MPNDLSGEFEDNAYAGNIGGVKAQLERSGAQPEMQGAVNTAVFDVISDPARFPKIDALVRELEKAGGDFEPVWRAIGDGAAVEKAILSMPEKSPGAETEKAAARLLGAYLAGRVEDPAYKSSFRALVAEEPPAQQAAMIRVQHALVTLVDDARGKVAGFSEEPAVPARATSPVIRINLGPPPPADDAATLRAVRHEMEAFDNATKVEAADLGNVEAYGSGGSVIEILPALAESASREIRQLLQEKMTVAQCRAPQPEIRPGARPPRGHII